MTLLNNPCGGRSLGARVARILSSALTRTAHEVATILCRQTLRGLTALRGSARVLMIALFTTLACAVMPVWAGATSDALSVASALNSGSATNSVRYAMGGAKSDAGDVGGVALAYSVPRQ